MPTTMTRDDAIARRVQRRVGTAAGVRRVAVPTGATSVAVTFATPMPDTNFDALLTPTWNTTAWVTGATRTGCTLNFGSAAPGAQTCALMIVQADA